MNRSVLPSLLGSLTFFLLSTPGLLAQDPPKLPPPGSPNQMQTVSDLRRVGTAMYHWWKAEMEPRQSPEARAKAVAYAKKAAEEVVSVDLTTVPVISHDELAKVLVPKYMSAVPEKDGWGHPYEFRLDMQDPNSLHKMAVRSGGGDGKFSGGTYKIEGFPAQAEVEDLAWMDGYFIRWPEAGN